MRTSTAAWTAALAVMSMNGPFTTAEAAPAQQYGQDRPRNYMPKHVRRGGYNSSASALESSTSSEVPPEPETSITKHISQHHESTSLELPPPLTTEEETSTHTRRTRSSTKTSPSDDEMLSSFLAEGLLPMTTDAVVTTTMTLTQDAFFFPKTETYTWTYTETDSAPSSSSSASMSSAEHHQTTGSDLLNSLTTSISIPLTTSVETSDRGHTMSPTHQRKPDHTETLTSTPSSKMQQSSASLAVSNSSVAAESSSLYVRSSTDVYSSSSPGSQLSSTEHRPYPIETPHPSHNASYSVQLPTGIPALSSSLPYVSAGASSEMLSSSEALSSMAPLSSSIAPSSNGFYFPTGIAPSLSGIFGQPTHTSKEHTRHAHYTPSSGSSSVAASSYSQMAGTGASSASGGFTYPSGTGIFPPPVHTKTKTHDSALASSSAAGNTGFPFGGTGVLPFPEHTRTKDQGSHTQGLPPIGSILPTGSNGILPFPEPSPTRHHRTHETHSQQSDSTSHSGHIIVGLSTTISVPYSGLPTGTHHSSTQRTTTSSGLLGGLTGLPTGLSLTLPTGLPISPLSNMPSPDTSIAPIGRPPPKRPHDTTPGLPVGLTSGFPSLSLTAAVSSLTNQLSQPTGVFPPASSGVPTGTSTSNDSTVPPASGGLPISPTGVVTSLPSGLSGVVTGLTSALSGAESTLTGLTSAFTTDTSLTIIPTLPSTNTVTDLTSTTSSPLLTGTGAGSLPVVLPTPPSSIPLSQISTTNSIPSIVVTSGTEGSGTGAPSIPGIPLSTPTDLTITGAGTSVTVPVPSLSTGTSVVVTGTDGYTTTSSPSASVVTGVSTPAQPPSSSGGTSLTTTSGSSIATYPASTTSTTPASSPISQSGYSGTAPTSATPITSATPTTSSAPGNGSSQETGSSSVPGYGSTTSASIGLSSGTTLSLGATGSAPSSYVSPTPPASSVPVTGSPSASGTPSSTSQTVVPETTQQTMPTDSIKPTGTDTFTSLVLPTTWSFAPSGTKSTERLIPTAAASASATSAPSAFPTYLPELIQPPGGMPVAPEGKTLIQVGFLYGLNYEFVVNEPQSASQIFQYLPEGLAYGLAVSRDDIVMHAIVPDDTSRTLNYMTTLAQAYVPSDLVGQLQMSLHTPLSNIYDNPDTPVKALMHMINPTIPLLPGPSLGTTSSTGWNPAATGTTTLSDGAPIGGDSGSSNKVRGTSVGIAAGAVCGAAVYAAAMIYVARRYRKKKQGHQRASSVPTAGEMTQSGGMGGFFMSGANGRASASGSGGRASRTSAGSSNGRSVREQGISAPIMAENSLGWT